MPRSIKCTRNPRPPTRGNDCINVAHTPPIAQCVFVVLFLKPLFAYAPLHVGNCTATMCVQSLRGEANPSCPARLLHEDIGYPCNVLLREHLRAEPSTLLPPPGDRRAPPPTWSWTELHANWDLNQSLRRPNISQSRNQTKLMQSPDAPMSAGGNVRLYLYGHVPSPSTTRLTWICTLRRLAFARIENRARQPYMHAETQM